MRVERSTNGAPFAAIATLPGDAQQYTDPAAPTNSRYRVLAYDTDPCDGTYSNVVAAKN